MKINKKIIEELVSYLKEFNLSEIEFEEVRKYVKKTKRKKAPGPDEIPSELLLLCSPESRDRSTGRIEWTGPPTERSPGSRDTF